MGRQATNPISTETMLAILTKSLDEDLSYKKLCMEFKVDYTAFRGKLMHMKRANLIKFDSNGYPIYTKFEKNQINEIGIIPKKKVIFDAEVHAIKELKKRERLEAEAIKGAIKARLIDKKTNDIREGLTASEIRALTSSLETCQAMLYRSYAVAKDSNLDNLGAEEVKDDVMQIVFVDSTTAEDQNGRKINSNVKSQVSPQLEANEKVVNLPIQSFDRIEIEEAEEKAVEA